MGNRVQYVYGPVKSWRSGTSLGIDPIGEISTCSFNCSYCQLGKIQNITQEIKVYVETEKILEDFMDFEQRGLFSFAKDSSRGPNLDVITFAGSGEPCLAKNLDEIILSLKDLQKNIYKSNVPISILTNATLLHDKAVRKRTAAADKVSLKLDAPNDQVLKSINQAAPGISVESIISGIEVFAKDYGEQVELQLQMMFMPKFVSGLADGRSEAVDFVEAMAKLIKRTGVTNIQINTPSRPKPMGEQYHIETRGNHYAEGESVLEDVDFIELPLISKEDAFAIEDRLRDLLSSELEIINVYQR